MFKVGDRVLSKRFGEGKVFHVFPIPRIKIYPVLVTFGTKVETFTKKGFYFTWDNERDLSLVKD